MSKIRIHFDDLCAFFTKYPERLMVGMMPTEGDGAEHRHEPHVVIRQGGVVVREYRGFDEVHGDISLRVSPQALRSASAWARVPTLFTSGYRYCFRDISATSYIP